MAQDTSLQPDELAELDAAQAARSPDPAAKAQSLARSRAQSEAEVKRVQEAYDRALAERKARRETP